MRDSPLYDPLAAADVLARADLRVGDVIARVGPPELGIRPPESLFEALLRSIVYQQLSGKAAATILGRIIALLGGTASVESLNGVSDEALRAAGLSWSKIASARDLAAHIEQGVLPTLADLERMDGDKIIESLTVVRGIGPWTVQMLLIFRLGRPDIWPTTDLGIRKGVAVVTGVQELPSPREVDEFGIALRPWRSVAAWYMWRALELPQEI